MRREELLPVTTPHLFLRRRALFCSAVLIRFSLHFAFAMFAYCSIWINFLNYAVKWNQCPLLWKGMCPGIVWEGVSVAGKKQASTKDQGWISFHRVFSHMFLSLHVFYISEWRANWVSVSTCFYLSCPAGSLSRTESESSRRNWCRAVTWSHQTVLPL